MEKPFITSLVTEYAAGKRSSAIRFQRFSLSTDRPVVKLLFTVRERSRNFCTVDWGPGISVHTVADTIGTVRSWVPAFWGALFDSFNLENRGIFNFEAV